MSAFDEAWWDARTLHLGRIDPHLDLDDPRRHWVRWRLIDELLQRYYLDVGLEPVFAHMGKELYNIGLISPTCLRAPRYFGRLCQTGVHAHDDSALVDDLGVPLTWTELGGSEPHEPDEAMTWTEYRRWAIAALGLEHSSVVGHEGCFHRRGKALTPMMFRLALLIRSAHSATIDENRMITLVSGVDVGEPGLPEALTELVEACGRTIPAGPPRYLGVQGAAGDWLALCTDGWIATRSGPVDAAALWRSGHDLEDIARAIPQR